MRSIPAILALIPAFLVTLPGCRSTPASTAEETAAAPALVGTEWVCVEIGGAQVDSSVKAPTLRFTEDGRIAGATPVNRYGAPFELAQGGKAHGIRFGPVMSTRMAGEESEMRVESGFTRALGSVESVKVVGDRLELWSDKACVLAFARVAK